MVEWTSVTFDASSEDELGWRNDIDLIIIVFRRTFLRILNFINLEHSKK